MGYEPWLLFRNDSKKLDEELSYEGEMTNQERFGSMIEGIEESPFQKFIENYQAMPSLFEF